MITHADNCLTIQNEMILIYYLPRVVAQQQAALGACGH